MKTKQLFSKTLCTALFAGALFLGSSAVFAQVKIGTNPTVIGTNSNLEVESSNGTKVVVDKTSGFVGAGVTDPTQSIDGAGTGRLRNIPISTNNKEILTVDANGVIYKQAADAALLPTIIGSLAAAGPTIPANGGNANTGSTITLPANSKYIVNILIVFAPSTPLPTGTSTWVRGYLADSPSATITSADVVGGPLASGSLPANSGFATLTGSIRVQNTSSSPKTYYFKVSSAGYGTVTGITLYQVGGASYAENQIYAIPYN